MSARPGIVALLPIAGTVLMVSVLVILAYPLSLGPMFWYAAGDNPFWVAFYAPLGWVVEHEAWGWEWLMAYLEWWVA